MSTLSLTDTIQFIADTSVNYLKTEVIDGYKTLIESQSNTYNTIIWAIAISVGVVGGLTWIYQTRGIDLIIKRRIKKVLRTKSKEIDIQIKESVDKELIPLKFEIYRLLAVTNILQYNIHHDLTSLSLSIGYLNYALIQLLYDNDTGYLLRQTVDNIIKNLQLVIGIQKEKEFYSAYMEQKNDDKNQTLDDLIANIKRIDNVLIEEKKNILNLIKKIYSANNIIYNEDKFSV